MRSDKKVRVADYVMSRLALLGIRQVFYLPGGGAMHLNDALGIHPALDPILCLHEQACGVAAEAAGKLLSGPSACLVTSGPGATNVLTATLGAWLDSTPVFFVSGQVKTADLKVGTQLRMLGVQEADIVTIVQSITKLAVTLTDPLQIGIVFDQLELAALSGRRGPVWLDVPLDVQAMLVDPDQLARLPRESSTQSVNSELAPQVKAVIELLMSAKRPVLVVGHGVRSAQAANELMRFAERSGIPVHTTWLGMDIIAEDHPLYAGRPGSIAPRWANFALQNSDFLLAIGARLDMALTAYSHERFARSAKKVMVDIDRAEIEKMRMEVAIPIVSDARDFLMCMERELAVSPALPCYAPWRSHIRKWRQTFPLIQPEHRRTDGLLSLYQFTDVLSDVMSEDDIIATGSAGFSVELFLLALKLKKGQRCFHNRGTGAMGFGLPAAIGACLAGNRRRTICVEGDGSLQMNVQELATLAVQKLPVHCFIINNGGYASIRASQQNYFQRQFGADANSGLVLPNLELIATAYGIPYMRIENGEGLAETLHIGLGTAGPILCEVIVMPEEPRIPRVTSRQLENGKMVSSPLEDLFPFLDRDELARQMIIPLLKD
jgi:acetolactate synthase-1/2/3 large subunit